MRIRDIEVFLKTVRFNKLSATLKAISCIRRTHRCLGVMFVLNGASISLIIKCQEKIREILGEKISEIQISDKNWIRET